MMKQIREVSSEGGVMEGKADMEGVRGVSSGDKTPGVSLRPLAPQWRKDWLSLSI